MNVLRTDEQDLPDCRYCEHKASVLIRDPRAWQGDRPLCAQHALEKVSPWDVVDLFAEAYEGDAA